LLSYYKALGGRLPLLDHRSLDWASVRRVRYFCYQRFLYAYPGPIRALRQRLVVVPPARYGDQALLDKQLTVSPHEAQAEQHADAFGNQVWQLAIERVEYEVAFEVAVMVERRAPTARLRVSAADAARFAEATPLTAADERIRAVAAELALAAPDDEALAQRICDWVADQMVYAHGATSTATTAAEALAVGRGLCQDYAHLMIALCRAAGLRARYVSGHMLAEGGSHAWVEVLLPTGDGSFSAVGFDPTNRRRPDLRYTVVAVGRDYRDIAPTSGTYVAPYGGKLSVEKRAGLLLAELADGQLLDGAGAPTAPSA
jgi:transglutaminase-like putative cysteine protease